EQADVEAKVPGQALRGLLVDRQQIDQQRGEPRFVEHVCDVAIARAVSTRPRAVSEQHGAERVRRRTQIAEQLRVTGAERDLALLRHARSRKSRTCSSEIWEKSSYHIPTA